MNQCLGYPVEHTRDWQDIVLDIGVERITRSVAAPALPASDEVQRAYHTCFVEVVGLSVSKIHVLIGIAYFDK